MSAYGPNVTRALARHKPEPTESPWMALLTLAAIVGTFALYGVLGAVAVWWLR